ncbi:subclass B3 metallo-beta-lactamase [Massilia sp. TSP1-1-2]|uniref:subclass B3 metallo-beta-lactamase n=1 Tax=unclassified Massilia TaxID=2609279 RepID=UPI003CFA3103
MNFAYRNTATRARALACTLLLAAFGPALAQEATTCPKCAAWNQPQAPFNIYGNTWYVGTRELSALLITSANGHILLDGALPQSAAQIARNIVSLGFRIEDVKLIANSHAHADHAGGIAALQRASGAQVLASASGAQVLKAGTPGRDDPQYSPGGSSPIPVPAAVRTVADGETVSTGLLAITAHLTPGHTPGGTTWSWKSCEGKRCLDVVYVDSLNPVSSEGFHFTGDSARADLTRAFRASIAKVAALPCDVVVSVHPDFTGTLEKAGKRSAARNAFIDPAGCRTYAKDAGKRLDKRVAREALEALDAARAAKRSDPS